MIKGKRAPARLRWVAAGFAAAAAWLFLIGGARADGVLCEDAHEFDPCFIVGTVDGECGLGVAGLPDGSVDNVVGECRDGECCVNDGGSDAIFDPPDAAAPPSGEVSFGGGGCAAADGLVTGGVWVVTLTVTALAGYRSLRGSSRSRRGRRGSPG